MYHLVICSWEKSREVNRKHLGGWSQFLIGLPIHFHGKERTFQQKPEGNKIEAIKILGRVFSTAKSATQRPCGWSACHIRGKMKRLMSSEQRLSSPPLSSVLLSVVSVIHGQLWSEKIKFKIPQINSSLVLNCVPFWVVGWNFAPSCAFSPGMWIITLSSVPNLYTLPACWWLSSHLAYQINCSIITWLVFK